MRRRNKIIIIIIICFIFTYIIYFNNKKIRLNILVLGDGIASGESCNGDNISYNDYLRIEYDNNKLLHSYNDDYAYKNNKIIKMIDNINNNVLYNNKYIKQLIHKSDIITISFGEEELIKLTITNDFSIEYLNNIINYYDELLKILKDNTDGKIIIIGFYENSYLDKTKVIIMNSELANLAKKYQVIFININDLLITNNYFDNNCYYFNNLAHQEITKLIINSI